MIIKFNHKRQIILLELITVILSLFFDFFKNSSYSLAWKIDSSPFPFPSNKAEIIQNLEK